MAKLKISTAPQITLANAASAAYHAVRKYEFDAAIGAVPSTTAMNAAITAAGHPAVTIGVGHSLALTLGGSGQVLNGDVNLIPAVSGLSIYGTGLGVVWGTGTNEVARGDHTHAQLHDPATGVVTDSFTISVTGQAITGQINLASGSGLLLTGGLGVDFTAVAAYSHTHANATDSTAGFMSAADKTSLDALVAATGFSPAATSSITLTLSTGTLTADLKLSTGLITDGTGVAVDLSVLDARYMVSPPNNANWRINAKGELQFWDKGTTPPGYRTKYYDNGQDSPGPVETS